MPRDDRERHFENALTRNLQTHASSPAHPSAADCPDAEILAAYHERSLPTAEMVSRKQHIASCPSCQEVLSQLQATDKILLEADEPNSVPQDTVAVPQAHLVNAARTSAAPTAIDSLSKSTRRPKELQRRTANWRWLAPAGALAAILLVWVAVRESTAPEFQLAKNQPAPAPAPAAPSPRSAPPSLAKKEPARKDQLPPPAPTTTPAEKDDASADGDSGLFDLKAEGRSAAPKLTAPHNSPKPRNGLDAQQAPQTQSRILAQSPYQDKQRAGREPASQAPAAAPAAPPSAVAALSPGVVTESVTVESSATPVPVSPPAPEPSRAKKPESPAGIAGSTDTLTANSSVTQPVNGHSLGGLAQLQTVVISGAADNSVMVSAPDSTTSWRLGSSGIVERSTDAGSHWSLQKSGIIADLLAGSAPTKKVCWIVGRTGAILHTTNAGKHWNKVTSPTTEDISSVFAVDAQQATFTTTTNKSYKTTNAGKTWTPLPTP
jgi:hypothetical protein